MKKEVEVDISDIMDLDLIKTMILESIRNWYFGSREVICVTSVVESIDKDVSSHLYKIYYAYKYKRYDDLITLSGGYNETKLDHIDFHMDLLQDLDTVGGVVKYIMSCVRTSRRDELIQEVLS